MATHALTDVAIVLHPQDDVAIAKKEIKAGTVLADTGGVAITARQDIRPGHKVARHARAAGETVRRYGQVIGFATEAIAVGDHVHTQNLGIGELAADRYEVGVDVIIIRPRRCATSTATSARTAASARGTTWPSSPASTAPPR